MTESYKKFTLCFIAALLLFILAHYLIWRNVTEVFFTGKWEGGDISRLGYILDSKLYRKNHTDLPRQHIELEHNKNNEKVDVFTLGDSFANFGGGGKNRYFQDYIATLSGVTVENFKPYSDVNFLSTLAILVNNGYLDKITPRHVILSSSEKLCVERYAVPIDFAKTMTMTELLSRKRFNYDTPHLDVKFINTGNLNYVMYRFLYYVSPNALFSKAYKVKLSRDFFSVANSNILLFYKNDLKSIGRATDGNIKLLNDNMNVMADILARKGIKFYFMPCVDKYNVYSEYIVNNRYPRSVFFEKLRKLPKRYVLIDTKDVLLKELQLGKKDIFYPDDTHWSWKASEAIFSRYLFN